MRGGLSPKPSPERRPMLSSGTFKWVDDDNSNYFYLFTKHLAINRKRYK